MVDRGRWIVEKIRSQSCGLRPQGAGHSNRPLRPSLPLSLSPFLLAFLFLLSACGLGSNAELVIEACLDQDGNPLPPGVVVEVSGREAVWEGQPLVFPVRVKGDVGLVEVETTSEQGYTYLSKPEYDVRPNTSRSITLRFFKPYTLTVETGMRQAGLDVYANGQPIGTTAADGTVTWHIDHPNTPAGIARPGTRFDIALKEDGTWTRTEPVILAEAQYAYAAAVDVPDQVNISPPANPGGLAANRPSSSRARRPVSTRQPPLPQVNQAVPVPPARLLTEAERDAEEALAQTLTDPATDLAIEPMRQPEEPSAIPVAAERPSATSTAASPLNSMQQADRAFAQGQYDEAMLFYERVPRSEEAAYKHALDRIGEIRLIRKNYEGAIAAYNEILLEDPSEYAAHNNLAAVYLATESYDQALNHLEQVLARKHLIPRDKRTQTEVEVRYNRATIYYAQFEKERDPITKREQGLLTMSVLRTFLDRTPADDPAFSDKRQDIEMKLENTRQWVTSN